MDFKDYYKTLGLTRHASEKDIKSAFKQLAKQHHPDTEGGSEEKFKEINEAYEVLKDQNKRGRYDYLYSTQNGSSGAKFDTKTQGFKHSKMYNNFNSFADFYQSQEPEKPKPKTQSKKKKQESKDTGKFSDFFEKFFGQYSQGEQAQRTSKHPKKQPKRGEDFEMEIELSLEDAYQGCLRKIEISTSSTHTRRLEVSIPPGVRSGTKIKVSNEGKPGQNGGDSGDLYLKVKLKDHDQFWIENDDIHSEITIEPQEAVLGSNKRIATLDEIIELVIPPDTHSGRVLRLRDKGMKNSRGEILGDHYVHVVIDIPNGLSDEETTTYKYLRELGEKRVQKDK